MFCTNCGNQMLDGSKFCTKCGAPMGALAPEVPAEGASAGGADAGDAPAHGGAQRFARLGKEVLFVHIALLRPCQAEIRGGFPGIDPYIAIPFRNAVASVHLKREPQRFACIGGIRLFRRRRKCGQQHNRRKKSSHSPAVLAFHPRTLLSKT